MWRLWHCCLIVGLVWAVCAVDSGRLLTSKRIIPVLQSIADRKGKLQLEVLSADDPEAALAFVQSSGVKPETRHAATVHLEHTESGAVIQWGNGDFEVDLVEPTHATAVRKAVMTLHRGVWIAEYYVGPSRDDSISAGGALLQIDSPLLDAAADDDVMQPVGTVYVRGQRGESLVVYGRVSFGDAFLWRFGKLQSRIPLDATTTIWGRWLWPAVFGVVVPWCIFSLMAMRTAR